MNTAITEAIMDLACTIAAETDDAVTEIGLGDKAWWTFLGEYAAKLRYEVPRNALRTGVVLSTSCGPITVYRAPMPRIIR